MLCYCKDLMSRRKVLGRLAVLAAMAVPSAHAAEPTFADNFTGMPLLDQDGRRFSFQRLKGRILLVHFVFTGCSTVCPIQTRALVDMLGGLSPQVRAQLHIVSVSLDPLSDSPAVLKAYGGGLGVDFKHWSMVTGRPPDIERIAQGLRLFKPAAASAPQPKTRQANDHATRIWLVDQQGRLLQRYPGDPPDVKRLQREITSLLALRP